MPYDLDQTSFQALLSALGQDPAEAGRAYENLRLGLIRFFHWNHCESPEDLADATLDRLAGKLSTDAAPVLDPRKFAAGIARMLLHEHFAHQSREKKMLSWISRFVANHPRDEEEHNREDALSHCLDRLSSENRQMLERYYTGDVSKRIRNRQNLAGELGVGINALRNRALRLRQQLEDCTSRYLTRISGKGELRTTLSKGKRKVS